MRRTTPVALLIMVMAVLTVSVSCATAKGEREMKAMKEQPVISTKAFELHMAMAKLWEDHIAYTRNYIISALAGLEDADAVAGRLLENQQAIGDAIKPYYGDAAGEKLTALLKDHIVIATDVVAAAKAGNSEALERTQDKWAANADDIAAFLAGANPLWSKDDLSDALRTHLEVTTDEVTARLKKDWKADIKAYDRGQDHMLKFSDTLSSGIARQFPEQFKD